MFVIVPRAIRPDCGANLDSQFPDNTERQGRQLTAPCPGFRSVAWQLVANGAGEQGLEPQLPDPESGVLPLDDSPSRCATSKYSDLLSASQAIHV